VKEIEISDLLGMTFTSVCRVGDDEEDDAIFFTSFDGGRIFKMYHDHECSEIVRIEDICGELSDLMGSPITMAEVITQEGVDEDECEHVTWTFYKLATIKGYVTIRWYGSSNGFYSETAEIVELEFCPICKAEIRRFDLKLKGVCYKCHMTTK
jgi:hypothetical protein